MVDIIENVSIFFLNKYKKENRVIELDLAAGKKIKEVAKELHMSFTSISNIIKASERKKELQTKREENNQNGQIKKPLKYLKLISYLVMVKNLLRLQLN